MKKETLEEAALKLYPNRESFLDRFQDIERKAFIKGYKLAQERSYSEEEVLHILYTFWDRLDVWYNEGVDENFILREWFNECELKKK
jgi:hypothetical protein